MLIGQSITAPAGTSQSDPHSVYYGPWAPRGGDAGNFLIEVMHISSSNCEVTAKVEHKNSEQADTSAAVVATFSPDPITAIGTYKVQATGLKELVRYKYELVGVNSVEEWAHLRANPPIWQPN